MLTRIKIMSKILCLLMVSFLFFHCRSSNTSDPSDIHQNITFSYVCTNGTASLEPSATEDTEKCIACDTGYVPSDDSCVSSGRLNSKPRRHKSINFKISPDGTRVVYKADSYKLYSVPIGGGTVKKLNSTLVNNGDVHSSRISPDSTRMVYSAEQDRDRLDIYSVLIIR